MTVLTVAISQERCIMKMKNLKSKIMTLFLVAIVIAATCSIQSKAAVVRPDIPQKVVAVSNTKGKVKLKITTAKNTTNTIAYSTSKTQLKKVKKYSVKKVKGVKFIKKSKKTVAIKKLKKTKKYYFKVCAFQKSGNKNIYSKWSKVIKITPNGSKKAVTVKAPATKKPTTQTVTPTINTSKVTLYGLGSWATGYVKIPASYLQSQALKVTGAKKVTYSVTSGTSVQVSSTGVVTPKVTTWYWTNGVGSLTYNAKADSVTKTIEAGDSVIKVVADGKTFNVKVSVVDYANYYAENEMNNYIKKNITSSMTTKQKIEAICKYVAGFDYSTKNTSAVSMIVGKGGDGWASTDAIVTMCTKVGLGSYGKTAMLDNSAVAGHRNAVVVADGKYYVVDAGYEGKAPRKYSIDEYSEPAIYTSNGSEATLVSYFGKDKTTYTVASTYQGVPVTKIGYAAFYYHVELTSVTLPNTIESIEDSAFYDCASLKTLNIPASVKNLSNLALTCCYDLSNFKFDSNNDTYSYSDGVVYNKDKTKTITSVVIPNGKCIIPSTVTEIGEYTFYTNDSIASVEIPSSVKSINASAFEDCTYLTTVTLSEGLETIGDYAFKSCASLNKIKIPSTVKALSDKAFQDTLCIHPFRDDNATKRHQLKVA